MIYFIQAGKNGPIKIGKAGTVDKRLKSLQTANHEELFVLQAIPGETEKEAKIKKDLKQFQLKGEWFRCAPEVLEYIRRAIHVEYEIYRGFPFPVLYRDSDDSKTDMCPFCGERHKHGKGDGHRMVHCKGGSPEIVAKDGTVLSQSRGYVLRTRKP